MSAVVTLPQKDLTVTSPLETAVAVLSGDAKSSFVGALLRLHEIGGTEADAAVMGFVHRMSAMGRHDDLYCPEIHGVAIRVAAELDPDRDVGPFLAFLDAPPPRSRLLLRALSWGVLGHPDTFPRSAWGYTRLRRLDPPPVARYAVRLRATSTALRASAAMALGDTADLGALDPLGDALADRSVSVRFSAVNSVRRLHHAGAAAVLPGHPAQEGLVALLRARESPVRRAAVQALVLLGRVDLVEEVIRSRATAGDLPDALARGVTPLARTWPGDQTIC
ncbi:hypothetical protein DMA15_17415 [Streptomyces sp. WAC 01529]|uniref:HEAT repeat domain-containing protein n=1 Tax=Streptomyces sp. WAC 01529 TaxID=2203205 RepID=UPI000F6B40C7|nr:hypothetical protein [Streptomyces sp. WAC 01529]AZM54128.1 hypothetical protein DMA15_17415 [Streptomyces sp. WAC 01529]